jgi:hypothetical protein
VVTIGERPSRRLGQRVQRVGVAGRWEALESAQDLDLCQRAGGGGRGQDLDPPVGRALRAGDDRLAAREVGAGDQAAVTGEVAFDRSGDLPGVEAIVTAGGDDLERARQLGLAQ